MLLALQAAAAKPRIMGPLRWAENRLVRAEKLSLPMSVTSEARLLGSGPSGLLPVLAAESSPLAKQAANRPPPFSLWGPLQRQCCSVEAFARCGEPTSPQILSSSGAAKLRSWSPMVWCLIGSCPQSLASPHRRVGVEVGKGRPHVIMPTNPTLRSYGIAAL